MTEVALQILNQPSSRVRAFRELSLNAVEVPSTKEIYILGAILMSLQILDGVLTAVGIQNFGVAAEGNPFLRNLMEVFGPLPSLVLVKFVAILIVGYLCTLASEVSWIKHALKGMICVYTFCAVIPWTTLLYIHFV